MMNDELVSLIVFMLSIYGGANGIVFSRLLLPLRLRLAYKSYIIDEMDQITSAVRRTSKISSILVKLVQCPLGVGFWLGVFYSLAVYSPSQQGVDYREYGITCTLFDGFLGSAAAWIMHLLMQKRQDGSS